MTGQVSGMFSCSIPSLGRSPAWLFHFWISYGPGMPWDYHGIVKGAMGCHGPVVSIMDIGSKHVYICVHHDRFNAISVSRTWEKLSETQPSEPRITSPCNARQQHAATIKLHWDGSGSTAESSPGWTTSTLRIYHVNGLEKPYRPYCIHIYTILYTWNPKDTRRTTGCFQHLTTSYKPSQ